MYFFFFSFYACGCVMGHSACFLFTFFFLLTACGLMDFQSTHWYHHCYYRELWCFYWLGIGFGGGILFLSYF